MNRIHRKLEYALMSLKHMSEKNRGELTTVKEICRKYEIPFDATARVLQLLVQGKFLKSEQGAQGGYLIIRDLADVNLLELIEKVVGPVEMVKCVDTTESKCEIKSKCNIITPLVDLNEQLIGFYKGINVSQLLKIQAKKVTEKTIEKTTEERISAPQMVGV